MDEPKFEPFDRNELPHGVTVDAIVQAVHQSGYPLQTRVASLLRRRGWWVQEEWDYIDADSHAHRALDVCADLALYDLQRHAGRLYPRVALLAECKQTANPFVFFRSYIRDDNVVYPPIAGLLQKTIEVTEDLGLPPNFAFPHTDLLDLSSSPFIDTPPRCATFSLCRRKGKGFELSGSDVFDRIVMPLQKATEFYERQQAPMETQEYFHPHIVVSVAVLGAPIMLCEPDEQDRPRLNFVPWVRLYRHQAEPDPESVHYNQRHTLRALDVVHASFLSDYLTKYLAPFVEPWAERAMKVHEVLASGFGYIPELQNEEYSGPYSSVVQPLPAGTFEAWDAFAETELGDATD